MSAHTENSRTAVYPALNPGKWVRPKLLPIIFGINEEQARKYRERGVWLEGKHWCFDPIRRVVYNPSEIENWFEGKL